MKSNLHKLLINKLMQAPIQGDIPPIPTEWIACLAEEDLRKTTTRHAIILGKTCVLFEKCVR